MARTTATNFTGGLQFPYATAAADLFKKEDVQTLAQAVDQHTHGTGLGLPLVASAIPAALITSSMLAAGAAATNVGTLGGSLGGTLPNPTIAAGSIGSAQIADGSIATVDIGTDAVSALAAFAQLAGNTTTSTSMVAVPGTSVTLACTGGDLIVWWAVPLYNVSAANACSVGLKLDSGTIQVVGFANLAGGQGTSVLSGVLAFTGTAAGSHTVALYWSTVAGTLSQQPAALTSLVMKERRR